MKARIFRKDILLLSTYYIQEIKRLQTRRTINGYVVGSWECDDSHGPLIFTNPGKYFVILRPAYEIEHLGGGSDGVVLSICHLTKLCQREQCQLPVGMAMR